MSIVCVTPSIRPECHREFVSQWRRHFDWHGVKLLTVWDGDEPRLELDGQDLGLVKDQLTADEQELVFNKTDSVRSAGFLWAAANLKFDTVISLDDDTAPLPGTDPVGDLIRPLRKRVPVSWMNSLMGWGQMYVRGFPYRVRNEAEVHFSHGLWRTVPDLDGPSQLYLTPNADTAEYTRPTFYQGPIPRGVLMPVCGMCVAFTREAAPYVYYAPQSGDTGFNRFGDIWMGVVAKLKFDELGWAMYTGSAVIDHKRASNVYKNLVQEAAGIEAHEVFSRIGEYGAHPYFERYKSLRERYATRMAELLELGDVL